MDDHIILNVKYLRVLYVIITVLMVAVVIGAFISIDNTITYNNNMNDMRFDIDLSESNMQILRVERDGYIDVANDRNEQISKLLRDIDDLKKEIQKYENEIQKYRDIEQINPELFEHVSRGGGMNERTMRVTAYTKDECDKEPSHPLYGITASGDMVKDWYTVAAGPMYPFGTRVYIPYFKDKPNKGIFVVKDRGGAIKNNCIDVYIDNQTMVNEFGAKNITVFIMDIV